MGIVLEYTWDILVEIKVGLPLDLHDLVPNPSDFPSVYDNVLFLGLLLLVLDLEILNELPCHLEDVAFHVICGLIPLREEALLACVEGDFQEQEVPL